MTTSMHLSSQLAVNVLDARSLLSTAGLPCTGTGDRGQALALRLTATRLRPLLVMQS